MAEDTKVAAGTAPVVVEEVVVKKVDEEEEPVEKLEEEEISSYKVSELADLEKKALREFKELISDAISKRELTKQDTPPQTSEQPKPEEPVQVEEEKEKEVEPPAPPPEEVELWGIRILADEKSDVVLLKFLRARDFKAKEAMAMLKSAVKWHRDFDVEGLLAEEFGSDLDSVVYTHGVDRDGRPVCYNVYGEFQRKELYYTAFSDAGKRERFLRWRIKFLEKFIRQQLDFSPGGICSLVQVNDLKNTPGPAKRELRQTTNQAFLLLQDNYPEFVAKQVFINVPWWYLAYNRVVSPFLAQKTKSKFVFAGPSKSAETLFRYIAPEQVPIQYGGLSNPNETDFSTADPVTDITVKPASKYIVELPTSEACTLVWELRVPGWEVRYAAEFVPSAEDGYTVIVSKTTKLSPTDEPVIKNSFKIGEPGKVVLRVDNTSSKKKNLLYRSKTKPSSEQIN